MSGERRPVRRRIVTNLRRASAVMVLGVATAQVAAGPVVSASGRCVTWRGRNLMLLGDSATQVAPMNGRLDLRAWLDRCRKEGHSTVHVWAFTGPRPDDWRLGSAPPLLPWVRRSDGTWDLMRFDEGSDPERHYWPRLRALCRMARERDMLVGITVLFGWAKEGGPGPGWQVHPFNRDCGGFAARSADIVRPADEQEIQADAWSEEWHASRKAQWHWERYCLKLIGETQALGNVWYDYRDEWSYLNTQAAAAEAHWRRFFTSRGCLWADRTGLGGLRVANPDVPPPGNTPAIKTEGEPYGHDDVRTEVWSRAMRGTHYLLHNDAREPNVASWDPTAAARHGVRPSDDLGRTYVGLCSRFLNRIVRKLDELAPIPSEGRSGVLWRRGPSELAAYAAATVASIEAPEGLTGRWSATVYDPITGRTHLVEPRSANGRLTIVRPSGLRDWALLLRRR